MRFTCFILLTIAAAATADLQKAGAQNVVEYEQDGIRWRQTTQNIRRPVVEQKVVQRQQTVYQPQVNTEIKNVEKTVLEPTVVYRWERRLVEPFNIIRSRFALVPVPYTVWQQKKMVVSEPVTTQTMVPTTRTVNVIERVPGFVEEPQTTRVAIGPASTGAANSRVATLPPAVVPVRTAQPIIGGIQQMDNSPSGVWR